MGSRAGAISLALILGAGVATILTLAIATAPHAATVEQRTAVWADGSYDQVEAIRGGFQFAPAAVDTSYDQVEAIRGGFQFAPAAVDRSYERVEDLRANPPGQ
jgi:hypothetical protein